MGEVYCQLIGALRQCGAVFLPLHSYHQNNFRKVIVKSLTLVAASFVIVGCANVPITATTDSIVIQDGGNGLAYVVKDAQEHCATFSKSANLVSSQSTNQGYVLVGSVIVPTAQQLYYFDCVENGYAVPITIPEPELLGDERPLANEANHL